jgi:hypothetical protein
MPPVYTYAGRQLQMVVLRYRDDREFLRKSLGLIIFLLCLHVFILALMLRAQLKRPKVTVQYIQSVRISRMYHEINVYAEKLMLGSKTQQPQYDVTLDQFFSPTRRCVARALA